MLYSFFSSAVHVGNLRSENEDSIFLSGVVVHDGENKASLHGYSPISNPSLFAVFDGMGGEVMGAEASQTSARLLADRFSTSPPTKKKEIESWMNEYIRIANGKLCERIRHLGKRMGTTLVSLWLWEESFWMFNIGDSRAYLLRNDELTQLSYDHTSINQLVSKGVVSAEQAKVSPYRNQLSQHLGVFEEELVLSPYLASGAVKENDFFLLCSDGLTDMVSDIEIQDFFSATREPSEIVNSLLDAALQAGGRDNISIIVSKVSKG